MGTRRETTTRALSVGRLRSILLSKWFFRGRLSDSELSQSPDGRAPTGISTVNGGSDSRSAIFEGRPVEVRWRRRVYVATGQIRGCTDTYVGLGGVADRGVTWNFSDTARRGSQAVGGDPVMRRAEPDPGTGSAEMSIEEESMNASGDAKRSGPPATDRADELRHTMSRPGQRSRALDAADMSALAAESPAFGDRRHGGHPAIVGVGRQTRRAERRPVGTDVALPRRRRPGIRMGSSAAVPAIARLVLPEG